MNADKDDNEVLPLLPPLVLNDPVIAAFKKDVDVTILIENLRLTPDQRVRNMQSVIRTVREFRAAGAHLRAS